MLFRSPVAVSQPVSYGYAESPLTLTPDGTRVVWPTRHFGKGVYATLRYADLDTPSSFPLPGELADVSGSLRASNSRVVFLASSYPSGVYGRIRSVAFGGGTDISVGNGAGAPLNGFELTPSGTVVVFVAGSQLFSAPADGSSAPVNLGQAPAIGPVQAFRITPDGLSAVFTAGPAGGVSLYVVPLDGGTAPFLLSSGSGDVSTFELSASGGMLAYERAGALHSVPIDRAREPRELAAPAMPGGGVETIAFDPGGTRIVFTADHLTVAVVELFSVDVEGLANPVRLNAPLPAGASLDTATTRVSVSPDGARVHFSGEHDVLTTELFSVPIGGGSAPVKLSSPRPLGLYPRRVLDFLLPSSGQGYVYRANAEDDGRADLYGPGPSGPVRLNASLGVTNYRVSADGARVVYGEGFGLGIDDTPYDLFGVPSDGSAPPVLLTTTPQPVDSYAIDALGLRAVYEAQAQFMGLDFQAIHSVPILGGTPIRVSGTRDVDYYDLVPDGLRVLFAAWSGGPPRRLYVTALDGSTPATTLHTFPSLESAETTVVSPDLAWVSSRTV